MTTSLKDDLVDAGTNAAALTLVMKTLQEQTGKISLAGLKNTADKSIDSIFKLQTNIIKTSRELGQSAAQAKMMETEIGKAAVNALEMGGNLEDVVKHFEQINLTLGRTTYVSAEALTNMEAMQKLGVKTETFQSFEKFFDKVGGGIDGAVQKQMELVNTAKSYGLNVGTFLGSVSGKLDILTKYGFPNGVKDLASMVAKSQVLGDTLSVAQGFADQIMDSPEKAYDAAAQLQTLGGSFSQLGDGARLLYLAQNDLKGLNDELINATRGMATFNKETGQFEISANERGRLRALKNSGIGIDPKELEETALKLAKQEKILGQLGNINLGGKTPEEEKELKETLANYAQLGKGGVVTIKGEEIGGLSAKQINEIMVGLQGKGSELSNNADNNVKMMQANMSAQEASTLQSNLFNQAMAVSVLKVGKFSETLDTVTAAQTKLISIINAKTVSSEMGGELVNTFKTNIEKTSNSLSDALTRIPLSDKSNAEQPPTPLTVTGAAKIEVDIKGMDLKFADVIKTATLDYVREEMKKKGYSF
jgi:hypothetical protein